MTSDSAVEAEISQDKFGYYEFRDLKDEVKALVKTRDDESLPQEDRDAAQTGLREIYDGQRQGLTDSGREAFLENPGFKSVQDQLGPDQNIESAVLTLGYFRTLPEAESGNDVFPGLDRNSYNDGGWDNGGSITSTLDTVRYTLAHEQLAQSDHSVFLDHPAVQLIDPNVTDYTAMEYMQTLPLSEAENSVFPGFQPSSDEQKAGSEGSFINIEDGGILAYKLSETMEHVTERALSTYADPGNVGVNVMELKLPEGIEPTAEADRDTTTYRDESGSRAAAELKNNLVENGTFNPHRYASIVNDGLVAVRETIEKVRPIVGLVASLTGEEATEIPEPDLPDVTGPLFEYDGEISIKHLAEANNLTEEQTLKLSNEVLGTMSLVTVCYETRDFVDNNGLIPWVAGAAISIAKGEIDEDSVISADGLNKEFMQGAPGLSDDRVDFINANFRSFVELSDAEEASKQSVSMSQYNLHQDAPHAFLGQYVAEQNNAAAPEIAVAVDSDIILSPDEAVPALNEDSQYTFRLNVLDGGFWKGGFLDNGLQLEPNGLSFGIWTTPEGDGVRINPTEDFNSSSSPELYYRYTLDSPDSALDGTVVDIGLLRYQAGDFDWGIHSDKPGVSNLYGEMHNDLLGLRIVSGDLLDGEAEIMPYLIVAQEDGALFVNSGARFETPVGDSGVSLMGGVEGTFSSEEDRVDAFLEGHYDLVVLGRPGSIEAGLQQRWALSDSGSNATVGYTNLEVQLGTEGWSSNLSGVFGVYSDLSTNTPGAYAGVQANLGSGNIGLIGVHDDDGGSRVEISYGISF